LQAVKITDKTVRASAIKKKYDYVKDEVNVLKRLYSKYIVKTYEVMETKNECLIFMELMRKNSLFSIVARLEEFKVWKYFRNLICGVEHCKFFYKIIQ
jgi:serine/threonine protein kinase